MILREAIERMGHSEEAALITDTHLDWPGPKILWVNSAWEKLTGYSSAEAVGKTPRIVQGEKTDRRVTRRLKKELIENGVFEGGVINYRRDGSEYFKVWRIVPLKESDVICFYLGTSVLGHPEEIKYLMNHLREVQGKILEKFDLIGGV